MKNIYIILIVLSLGLSTTHINAAPAVGSGFTYQGELIDDGSPANMDYDIKLDLYLELTGGSSKGSLTFNNVTVTNGLFSIDDVDFGDAVFSDHNQFYVEVAVQKAGGSGFDILVPRQRLQAVPYAVQAEFLAPGNASNGDVLQFDGVNWVGEALVNMSQWLTTPTGGTSLYTHEDVGIGVTYPGARLHVTAPVGENVFRVAQGNQIKLRVHPDNGGLSVGEAIVPPVDGLYVKGDVKQPMGSYGIPKFLVKGRCNGGNDGTSIIFSSVNNVNSGQVTIVSGGSKGTCGMVFPSINFLDNDVYFLATAEITLDSPRVINCEFGLTFGGVSTAIVCEGHGLGGSRQRTNFNLIVF